MDDLRALFFDVFGTVVDWRSGVAQALQTYGEAKGLDADWGGLADAWRAQYDPYMEEVRSGRRPWTKLDRLHAENVADAFAALDLPVPSETERHELALSWHRLDPWPDAVDGLARMKKSYIVAPVSNGHISLMVNMAKRAGLAWDAILGAEIAHTYKPRAEVYLGSAAALDLASGQCMMVAAHAGDLDAARAFGLRTAFVHRPLERGPDGKADDPPRDGADFIARDFNDLARQLGC